MRPQAHRHLRRHAGHRRGFTLIEVVISTLIVSTMLVAALQAVAASRVGLRRISDYGRGMLLAQDLMAEILQQAYADPAYGPDSFGLGASEAATGNRSLYDDVDDYDGWHATPPQYADGSTISWASDYERGVTVAWVQPGNPLQTSGSPTGVKSITVTVNRNGVPVAELAALRTIGWPSTEESGS